MSTWTAPLLRNVEANRNPKRQRGKPPKSLPRARFGLRFSDKVALSNYLLLFGWSFENLERIFALDLQIAKVNRTFKLVNPVNG